MTLPNFFVIGAPKAGTSSLYDYFNAHPEIYMTRMKEPRYFCYRGQENRLEYPVRTLEEYEAEYAGVTDEKAIGDASARYFEFANPAERIHALIPEAKIIISLRDPVGRAYSIYQMNLRNMGRNEGKTFLEALETDKALRRFYFDGLKPFYDLFDREKIKVVFFNDLVTDTAETVRGLFEFLEVRADFVPNLTVTNPGGLPKNRLLHQVMSNQKVIALGHTVLPKSIMKLGRDLRGRNLKKQAITPEKIRAAWPVFAEDLAKTQDLIGMDLSRLVPKGEAMPTVRPPRDPS